MLNYKAIEIFTNENARYRNQPVTDAVIHYIRGLKIAARCIVTRGIAGCDESGEIATGRVEVLSFNLPIRIYIMLPAAEAERVLAGLDHLVGNGIIAIHDLKVISHKAASSLFPQQLMVSDVMTPEPKRIAADRPLNDAAEMLLSSIFTGLPVVDSNNRPIGILTQGDLIVRGGMQLRFGLLSETGQEDIALVMNELAGKRVIDAMTSPAVTIGDNQPLTEAVDLMLAKHLKRLPVVNGDGLLVGMLSRLDIFSTVMREAPDWKAFQAQNIVVENVRTVRDITRRDSRTVSPDTPIDTIIGIINENDLQRVAVVDLEGRFLGLISDSDLLRSFQPDQEGFRSLLARMAKPFQKKTWDQGSATSRVAAIPASQVMRSDVLTVREEQTIEEAIRMMTDRRLKRLPVVDDDGRFKGMISRDSLLRTGYGRQGARGAPGSGG